MVDLNKGATVELVKALSDDIRVGADGRVYSTAGNSVRGQVSTLQEIANRINDEVNPRMIQVTCTILEGKRYDYYNNWALKSNDNDWGAVSFPTEKGKKYRIQARHVGSDPVYAVGFFSGDTYLYAITNNADVEPYTIDIYPPADCDNVRFSTNNRHLPPIKVCEFVDTKVAYVTPNGTGGGTETSPYGSVSEALESGATTILLSGGKYTEPIIASDMEKLHIIGDPNNEPYFDISETVQTQDDTTTGLKTSAYSTTSNDVMYKVFVSRTMRLVDTSGNADAYSVHLWTASGVKLLPKLTIGEVQNNENTWTYDGTNIYINCQTADTFKLVGNNSSNSAVFNNIRDLKIENVSFYFSGNTVTKVNSSSFEILNCKFFYSGMAHGLAIESSSGTCRNCTAYKNCFDGFNIHYKGCTTFVDCISTYNTDDGISHHDGSVGCIIGGEYSHNTKGGISPTYEAKVDVYNTLCVSNGYGLYYAVTNGSTVRCRAFDNLFINNNGYGLRVNEYNIISKGNTFSGNNQNTKADGNGSITEF